MRTQHVVTAFLLHPDTARPRLLLGKRSRAVRTYPGRWAAISGALPPDVAPEAQARREVREEAGLPASRLRFLLEGPPFATVDQGLAARAAGVPVIAALDSAKLRSRPRLWLDLEIRAHPGTTPPGPTLDRTEGSLLDSIVTEGGALSDRARRRLVQRHARALRALQPPAR